jgi:predicted DNA-binding protein with PD1-like motif
MNAKQISAQNPKTFALILETGDEVSESLLNFAKQNQLAASQITAIGAFHSVALGYFDWSRKDYKKINFNEQLEVLSLIGDIALDENNEPKIHAHVVLGRSDATVLGGHLLEAHVRPTLEVIITESPKHLRRRYDPESKLALIRPS